MTNLELRDVPKELLAELVLRAREQGMSVDHYVIGVLSAHVAQPTPYEADQQITGLHGRDFDADAG